MESKEDEDVSNGKEECDHPVLKEEEPEEKEEAEQEEEKEMIEEATSLLDEVSLHSVVLHTDRDGISDEDEHEEEEEQEQEDEEKEVFYSEEDLIKLSNTFPLLPSYLNNPSALGILSFLPALDLNQVGVVSRGMNRASLTPLLWKDLLLRDFTLSKQETSIITSNANISPPCFATRTENEVNISASSRYYMSKLKGISTRAIAARTISLQYAKEQQNSQRKYNFELCLEFSFLRMFFPLMLASIFSSMLLVAMWIDGSLSTNVYFGFIPMLLFLFYVLLGVGCNLFLYRKRDDSNSLFGEVWGHVSGPARFLYSQVFDEDNISVAFSVLVVLLLTLQIALLGVKLSYSTPENVESDLQWEVVFIPTWVMFALALITPCVGCVNFSLFAFLFFFMWIPFFVLFLCLSLKLKGMENNTKWRNIRIALVFIPFWVLEGAAMLGSLGALVHIVYTLRRNLRAYFSVISERLGLFAVVWGFLLPIVIAQSLVSALDDGHGNISSVDVVIPILVLLALFLVASLLVAFAFVTDLQIRHQDLLLERAGTAAIFTV